MPTTTPTQELLGRSDAVGDLSDEDLEAYAAALLASEVPEAEVRNAPRYYIDFFTDPENPVYFENGISYSVLYNPYTSTYYTLVVGYRLIVFEVDERKVLVKTADHDLRVHRFSFADIYSPEILTNLLQRFPHLTVDEFVEALGVQELLEHPSNLRNVETILAHVFGIPKYRENSEWGWFVSGYDLGISVSSEDGEMKVRVIDEETVISKMPKRKRNQPDGVQQLDLIDLEMAMSMES